MLTDAKALNLSVPGRPDGTKTGLPFDPPESAISIGLHDGKELGEWAVFVAWSGLAVGVVL